MSGLIIVPPLTITDAILESTDVPETDYAAYDAGTNYALDDRVIVVATHKIYQSLQAANLGNDPTLAASAAWWIEVSPTNCWKPFDTSNSTAVSQAGSLYYNLRPGVPVASVNVLNAISDTVRIRVTDPVEGVVYDETTSLLGTISESSWYAWYFDELIPAHQVIALDLPKYAGADIRIDLEASAGDVSCGVIVLGPQIEIGDGVDYGAKIGLQDYSLIETNDFGDRVLLRRANARTQELTLTLDNADIGSAYFLMSTLTATPCLWIGYAPYEPMSVFGIFDDFAITIAYPDESICSVSLKGLT